MLADDSDRSSACIDPWRSAFGCCPSGIERGTGTAFSRMDGANYAGADTARAYTALAASGLC